MLYVTTRNKHDAYTAPWTLRDDCAKDGGLYLPFRMPEFAAADIAALRDKSFGQTVADVLNLFFSTHLTGWDVEFSIGRYPVKIGSAGQKVLIAECWRNLEGSYEKMERSLAARICGCSTMDVNVTSWLRIAIRIAVLTAVFGELQRQETVDAVDVAVPVGDFSLTMAVWYCRRMGLPVRNIICGCNGNDAVWELLHMGQMRTVNGIVPELERLIHGILGVDETRRYCAACASGDTYTLLPHVAKQLRCGMFAAVVSRERMTAAIPNVHSTSAYVMGSDVAVAYSALMDYRAKTGERCTALLLADRNPIDDAAEVAAAMKITQAELKELLR